MASARPTSAPANTPALNPTTQPSPRAEARPRDWSSWNRLRNELLTVGIFDPNVRLVSRPAQKEDHPAEGRDEHLAREAEGRNQHCDGEREPDWRATCTSATAAASRRPMPLIDAGMSVARI